MLVRDAQVELPRWIRVHELAADLLKRDDSKLSLLGHDLLHGIKYASSDDIRWWVGFQDLLIRIIDERVLAVFLELIFSLLLKLRLLLSNPLVELSSQCLLIAQNYFQCLKPSLVIVEHRRRTLDVLESGVFEANRVWEEPVSVAGIL